MHTTQLIDQLSTALRPAPAQPAVRTVAPGLLAGAAASLAVVAVVYGVQPGLDTFDHGAPFAMKLAYAGTIAAVAVALAAALARPGATRRSWSWLALPVALLAVVAALQLAAAPLAAWPGMMFGGSWDECPWRVLLLSLPVFAGLVTVVRRQAPTDLRRAGTAIGIAAGGTAASLYALACTENMAAFVLVWYSLGIALSGASGALLGPRLLRW